MDPLTIAGTVITISSHCIQTAKAISGLKDKYKNAQMMITAIYTELTVVSASLGHIQGLISRDPATLETSLQLRPELQQTFDQALTGCILVFSVLDDEIQKLHEGVDSIVGRVTYMWKDEAMKELLSQIRGQQTALTLLIQAFQMSSVAGIKTLLQNNNVVLEQVAQRSYKLRQAHPKVRAPPSVFDVVIDDGASVFTYNSTASSTNFSFDDYLVNSQAYRRALAASRSDLNRKSPGADDSVDRSDDETIVGVSHSVNGNEDAVVKLIREALSTQPSAIVEVTKISDPNFHDGRIEFRNMNQYYSDLKSKYVKVKKLYFDKEAQIKQLQDSLDEVRSEKDRNQAERATEKAWLASKLEGLEHTKAFLLGKIHDLEQLDEEHKRYFQREETIHKQINANHDALISEMNDRMNYLGTRLEGAQTKAEQESLRAAENLDKVKELQEKILSIESEETNAKALLTAREEHIEHLKKEISAKNIELQRYKGYGAIIDQLRALSPASSLIVPAQTPLS